MMTKVLNHEPMSVVELVLCKSCGRPEAAVASSEWSIPRSVPTFRRSIDNYGYIVKKFFLQELGLNNDASITLQMLSRTKPIKESSLLCKLFTKLGTSFMAKLRGEFAFCIYDTHMVRVLAATSARGSLRLYQGYTGNHALVLSCGPAELVNVTDQSEIPPGYFKYGWHATPRKYASAEPEVLAHAREAHEAAAAALSGLIHDHHHHSPPRELQSH